MSRDTKTGYWYCHKKGYPNIPCSGSICKRKSDAAEYARMYDCLPNKVEQIEERRRAEFMRENGFE